MGHSRRVIAGEGKESSQGGGEVKREKMKMKMKIEIKMNWWF